MSVYENSLLEKYSNKKAFVFDLDNTIFPAKDYDFQVYYLFGQFMEYTSPGLQEGKRIVDFLVLKHDSLNRNELIDACLHHFNINEEIKENFERLFRISRLPLKLLMYKQVLEFMQELVTDRKLIFIVTSGEQEEQLNKIRQIEWNNLEKYLACYFVEETDSKTQKETLEKLQLDHGLINDDILFIGTSIENDIIVDFLPVGELVKV
ncbi:HAD family hydrolase [Solitalea koreensis]|uniref:FMN phosphatase YigB, HAD superfamily n=1 Tax=Solitalea koreensis TaxID=543615 RepID=A0A521BQA3_9SPHI|nr:HAD hydrolase-like protein [Solitalea koreensis]SMO49289.1 FMN phosphatase YigB, HAD superfamily [Solitalea koreensis]